MLETKAVHLLACPHGVGAIRKADEGEALGQTSLAVLGQEHTSDTAEALEHLAQLRFFRKLRDLLFWFVSHCSCSEMFSGFVVRGHNSRL